MRLAAFMLAAALAVQGQSAGELYVLARQAEKKGEFAKAYLYYAQAAAAEPLRREYWSRAQSLQTKALTESPPKPAPASAEEIEDDAPALAGSISEADLQEARRPLPPTELQAEKLRKSFDLKGDAKTLWLEITKAFGLDAVFDGDYQPPSGLRFQVDDVDYRDALRALEAATGSFLVPLGPKLVFVAKDTPQKRTDAEPTVALVVPIPEPVSIQEAQEMARSVQQAMEIQRFVIDSARRLVLLKDRVSKARPALQLFEQLLRHRPQVVLEVELLDLNSKTSSSFGLRLPDRFSLVNFGRWRNILPATPAGFARFLTFGAGKTFLGLGIADAELFASMTRSSADTLLRATLRSVDGQPASLHVGDKYPIMSQSYSSMTPGAGQGFSFPPTFTFEDLGLVLKITPKIHGDGEVSLEVEGEFKVLTGKAQNGIPIVANRKFNSKVRLADGEWAVVTGLMSSTESRSLAGIAGLSGVPILGPLMSQHGRDRSNSSTLLVIKPRVIGSPATQEPAPAFWVGSESRLLTPM
ncbi:MAG: type II and III secretion system protein [Bryobacterales bacterium]|nr:type II and III secretion system protein [Bryobacterales bacterium]